MLPPLRIRPTRLPRIFALSCSAAASGCGAGAFRQIVRIGPVGADRGGDLVVADLHDARGALADDRQRVGVGNARRHAVGQRVAALGGHHRAGREGQRIGRRFGRLHADDLGAEAEQVARQDAAADARALPDRHIEHVEVRRLAQQFERIGRNPQHQIGMEGRHDLQSGGARRGARPPRAPPENPRRARPARRRTPASRGSSRPCCRAARRSSPARRGGAPQRRGSGRDCRASPR